MRVAIVMTGHLRSLGRLRRQHERILARTRRSNDVELFIHTWADPNERESVEALVEELLPSAIQVDAPVVFDDRHLLPPGMAQREADTAIAQRFVSMWTSIARGYELSRQAERAADPFDVVVRTRPDVLWNIAHELERYEGTARFARYHAGIPEPSDLGFIVPRDRADEVFRLPTRIHEWAGAYRHYGYRVLVPEFALGYYLAWAGLPWDAAKWDAVLIRPDGERRWFDGDPDSRAYKSGRGIHKRFGDGLPYGDGAPTAAERIRAEVRFNVMPRSIGDEELVAQVPQLVEATESGDPEVVRALLSSLRRARGRLVRVMLAGMLLGASSTSALVRQAPRYPFGVIRLALTMGGFLMRRWVRRFRSSLQLGLRPNWGIPRSIQAPLDTKPGDG